jgi:inhibitor of KinA
MRYINMSPLGDSAVTVTLGERAEPETNRKVRLLSEYLARHPFDGMIEFVPAFTSVTVYYDPMRVFIQYNGKNVASVQHYPYDSVAGILKQMVESLDAAANEEPKVVEIPVCYGGEFGPDLEHVASLNGLTPEEVIAIHSAGEYLVYMLGFAPGFPYLGGMSERIAAPRRETPRLAIPAGTVGIAGQQTGVYPIETPGGWQLIGRSPTALFLPEKMPPTLLEAGNIVKFFPIPRDEYDRLERIRT